MTESTPPTNPPGSDDRFQELLPRYADDTLSESELAEFTELIRQDSRRAETLYETLYLASSIAEFAGASLVEPAAAELGGKQVSTFHTPLTVRYWRAHPAHFAALALSLTLLLWAGVGWFVVPRFGGGDPSLNVSSVARVTDLQGEAWAPGTPRHAAGDLLQTGETLELTRGYVEITFVHGAVVLLEAPVNFTVETRAAGTLTHGRLVARIEKPAERPELVDFSISTPLAQVIDLGTEFGVDVAEDGTTQVQVFQGIVEATPRGVARTLESQTIRLTQGESACIRAGATQFEDEQSAWQFVQEMPPESSQVIRPVAVECLGGVPFGPPELLIDGSGLHELGPVVNWTHESGEMDACCWKVAAKDLPATLEFDLGAEYDLQSLWIWNYSHPDSAFLGRCARRVRVEVSTAGDTFTSRGEVNLDQATQYVFRGQRLGMSGHARYVRIIVLEGYMQGEVGLGEVRFEGEPVVTDNSPDGG